MPVPGMLNDVYLRPREVVHLRLAAGRGEGQVAGLVEDDEVLAGEIIGHATLAAGSSRGVDFRREVTLDVH